MLYDPTPETIMADCHLVLSVDLDYIDADDLPRYSPLYWYLLGSAILFAYCEDTDCELRLHRTAADGCQQ